MDINNGTEEALVSDNQIINTKEFLCSNTINF